MDEGAILVRAPNWLGDTVMALPALRALRAARPGERITIVGRWAPLLAGQGVGDILLGYPAPLAERRRLNRAIGASGADVAIVLPNSLESALAATRWRARRRFGFDTDARRLFLTDAIPVPEPRLHQVDEYARLVEALGAQVTDPGPAWRLGHDHERDRQAQILLEEAGVSAGARIVGLHLGTSFGPSKLWPAASFARLSDLLGDAGLAPLLLGSPGDGAAAEAVLAASRRPPASLVGRDRPALLPPLLAHMSCLVSGDTGVAHLAAALGVPTVTLFGPTDPRLSAPRSAAAHVLSRSVPCSPCFLAVCPIEHPCLDGIDAGEVADLVRRTTAA
jgi:lipopolysaccharide heptosyltransferase II